MSKWENLNNALDEALDSMTPQMWREWKTNFVKRKNNNMKNKLKLEEGDYVAHLFGYEIGMDGNGDPTALIPRGAFCEVIGVHINQDGYANYTLQLGGDIAYILECDLTDNLISKKEVDDLGLAVCEEFIGGEYVEVIEDLYYDTFYVEETGKLVGDIIIGRDGSKYVITSKGYTMFGKPYFVIKSEDTKLPKKIYAEHLAYTYTKSK